MARVLNKVVVAELRCRPPIPESIQEHHGQVRAKAPLWFTHISERQGLKNTGDLKQQCEQNQGADQRFSLKQWFAAVAHNCRFRKTGSAHCRKIHTVLFQVQTKICSRSRSRTHENNMTLLRMSASQKQYSPTYSRSWVISMFIPKSHSHFIMSQSGLNTKIVFRYIALYRNKDIHFKSRKQSSCQFSTGNVAYLIKTRDQRTKGIKTIVNIAIYVIYCIS